MYGIDDIYDIINNGKKLEDKKAEEAKEEKVEDKKPEDKKIDEEKPEDKKADEEKPKEEIITKVEEQKPIEEIQKEAKILSQFIKQNGQAPNYTVSVKSKTKISPDLELFAFAKIIVYYYANKRLPKRKG